MSRPLLHALLNFGPWEPLARRLALLASQGILLRVVGGRHVPRRGGLVVAAAHPTETDLSAVAAAVPRSLEVVLYAHNLRLPLLGRLLAIRGAYPIRKQVLGFDESNAASLAAAAEAARAGRAVLIFPGRAGSGLARLAATAGTPVLPLAIHAVSGQRSRPRMLVIVRRPLAPPDPDAGARRRFVASFRRRFRRMGIDPGLGDELAVALDDPRLWRRPRHVVRRAGRVARLEGDPRLRRAARALRRGCAALRCSVGDLRAPPGLRHVVVLLLLLAPACAGLLLCGPMIVWLRLRFRKLPHPGHRRAARINVGFALAAPYGVALAVLGAAFLGPTGLLFPLVAGAGLASLGLLRPAWLRVWYLARVRRHGPRLLRILQAFDGAVDAGPRGP